MIPTYSLVFTMQYLPKNLANQRGHWSVRHKETKFLDEQVHLLTFDQRPPKPLKQARLTLLRASSGQMDADGLVNSFKGVIDALVTCKILENDAWENIGMPHYMQTKAPPKKGYIHVLVEENE